MKGQQPHPKLLELEDRCRRLGIPLTTPRRAVMEVLIERADHPTADHLFAEIAVQMPSLSRATVYRTLEKLVEIGLVIRVCHPNAAARFDVKTHRHQHLVCDRCGSIRDMEVPDLNDLPIPDTSETGFQIRDYFVQFRGLCRKCAES